MVFFNDSDEFHYEKPAEAADLRSGIVCSPNNFVYGEPLADGILRITALGNYDRWTGLDEPAYRQQKRRWYDRMVASAVRFVPDFRDAVVETEMFTPVTIRRFTGHDEGGHLRRRRKALRRHHAPAEPLRLRQRPGPGRHHRHHPQRHQHRQPLSAADVRRRLSTKQV